MCEVKARGLGVEEVLSGGPVLGRDGRPDVFPQRRGCQWCAVDAAGRLLAPLDGPGRMEDFVFGFWRGRGGGKLTRFQAMSKTFASVNVKDPKDNLISNEFGNIPQVDSLLTRSPVPSGRTRGFLPVPVPPRGLESDRHQACYDSRRYKKERCKMA